MCNGQAMRRYIGGIEYAPGHGNTFTGGTTATALWRDSSVVPHTVTFNSLGGSL